MTESGDRARDANATDPAEREWRLVREEARPGPMNMALDEVAAETAAAGGPRTVRVYRWEPSCLSMGYGQDPDTVDWGFCEREGIDVTRRQTGGGGIYHDSRGDISYSISAPADEFPGDLLACYHVMCEPVLEAFRELGVNAEYVEEERPAVHQPACYLREMHPAHDIVAGGGGGRKLSGNAQYRRRDAVIQHGSITYEVLAERHLGVFADPGITPAAFGERVVGIADVVDVSREKAVAAFESALADWCDAEEGSWRDAELERAREVAAEKYDSDDWIRGRAGAQR